MRSLSLLAGKTLPFATPTGAKALEKKIKRLWPKLGASGFFSKLLHRGSYMSDHVLINLLNELRKRDKMRGLPSIISLFRNEFNKFNKT